MTILPIIITFLRFSNVLSGNIPDCHDLSSSEPDDYDDKQCLLKRSAAKRKSCSYSHKSKEAQQNHKKHSKNELGCSEKCSCRIRHNHGKAGKKTADIEQHTPNNDQSSDKFFDHDDTSYTPLLGTESKNCSGVGKKGIKGDIMKCTLL